MKLALKLAVWMLAPLLLVIAIKSGLRLQREAELLENESARDNAVLAHALATAIVDSWAVGGEPFARRLISDVDVGGSAKRIRFLSASELEPAVLASTVDVVVPSKSPGGEWRTTVPVVVERRVVGAVDVSEVLTTEVEFLKGTLWRSVALTLVMVVVALIAAVTMGLRLLGRPLTALAQHALRVGNGDLDARLPVHGSDELAALARAFNEMTQRLQTAQIAARAADDAKEAAVAQLRHAERLATVGQLSAGLAHELGTPLHVVIGRAELVATGEVDGEEARHNARIVVEQGQRMSRIIRQLLDFARSRRPEPRATDPVALFQAVRGLLEPLARKRGVALVVVDDDETPRSLDADREQLEQVLVNLTMNAIQATHDGGCVTLRARTVDKPGRLPGSVVRYVRLDVADDGSGIPADIQRRIFDPFFTTKDVGEGTGLGLAVTHGLVSEHGGFVTFETAPHKGTTFFVHVPQQASRGTRLTPESAP